ncbi:3845_t:CDS:2, partial [Ambispora leptoticha]
MTNQIDRNIYEQQFQQQYQFSTLFSSPRDSSDDDDANRPHKCSICTRGFVRQEHLNRHMRTHTGERPFICKTCQKRFSRSDELTRHEKTHAKPFKRKDQQHIHHHHRKSRIPLVAFRNTNQYQSASSNTTTLNVNSNGNNTATTASSPLNNTFPYNNNIIFTESTTFINSITNSQPYVCPLNNGCKKTFKCSGHLARHIGTCTSKKQKSGGDPLTTSNNNKNADNTLLVNNSENDSPSVLEETSVIQISPIPTDNDQLPGECTWTPDNKNKVSFLVNPSLHDASSPDRTDRTGRILPLP